MRRIFMQPCGKWFSLCLSPHRPTPQTRLRSTRFQFSVHTYASFRDLGIPTQSASHPVVDADRVDWLTKDRVVRMASTFRESCSIFASLLGVPFASMNGVVPSFKLRKLRMSRIMDTKNAVSCSGSWSPNRMNVCHHWRRSMVAVNWPV